MMWLGDGYVVVVVICASQESSSSGVNHGRTRNRDRRRRTACAQDNLIYALVRALLLGLVEDVHVVGALDGRLRAVLDERDGVVELERRARLRVAGWR